MVFGDPGDSYFHFVCLLGVLLGACRYPVVAVAREEDGASEKAPNDEAPTPGTATAVARTATDGPQRDTTGIYPRSPTPCRHYRLPSLGFSSISRRFRLHRPLLLRRRAHYEDDDRGRVQPRTALQLILRQSENEEKNTPKLFRPQ